MRKFGKDESKRKKIIVIHYRENRNFQHEDGLKDLLVCADKKAKMPKSDFHPCPTASCVCILKKGA